MDTPVIRIENVSKRFVMRKDKSLKERLVNFGRSNLHRRTSGPCGTSTSRSRQARRVCLVGPNGFGESTLLKTIGGILQPTTGSVHLRGRLAALLELGAGFHPDLTGRDNVHLNASILGLSKKQTDQHFDAMVEFSGIEPFIDTQIKFLLLWYVRATGFCGRRARRPGRPPGRRGSGGGRRALPAEVPGANSDISE